MNQILKRNQVVRTVTGGQECTVEQFLGGGGQGEVYRADLGGTAVALKWYFLTQATDQQRAGLEVLIRNGPPNPRFLWPLDLATADGVEGFGYVMPLRDSRFKGIVDLMKRRTEPSFKALATAGVYLADSYLRLHAKGLCYRDISFGNVFFDPQTGDVLICDNDNVAIDSGAKSGVLGTPRFMAPEVVRGEAHPSTQTDLFSLGVLLFYMYMIHHPLEGKKEAAIKCFDLPAMTKIYGTEPVFIFDPADDSNRPVKGLHDNAIEFWPLYPQFLRDLFTQAFTAGIADPANQRVRETEWRLALSRLRDSIVYCQSCSAENFFDAEKLRTAGGPGSCWSCGKELALPFRMKIGSNIIVLNHDTQLFEHHIDSSSGYDFTKVIASVGQHPNDRRIWGLKNLSSTRWNCVMPDGRVLDVEPTRSVTLTSGVRIQFGKAEGEIRTA